MTVDDLEKLIHDSEKYNKSNLDKKKEKLIKEAEEFEFKNLLDIVELLFELRAKREKSIKDKKLIEIIEDVLIEEPFQYKDEDYILSAFSEADYNKSPYYKKK